jgi:hypothetical protein
VAVGRPVAQAAGLGPFSDTHKHYRHAVEQPPANLGPCLSGLFGEEAARLCLHDGNQIDGLNEILTLLSGRETPWAKVRVE